MSTNNKWGALSMRDRAFLIRESVKNGVTNLDEIRDLYNQSHQFSGKENKNTTIQPYINGAKAFAMNVAHDYFLNPTDHPSEFNDPHTPTLQDSIEEAKKGKYADISQSSFLFSKEEQKKAFENQGYTTNYTDYGLVKRAVGNRKLPVYQKNKDVINRGELTVVTNPEYTIWMGSPDTEIEHGLDYPSAVYMDKQGNFYQKAWDLNDYGQKSAGTGGTRYDLYAGNTLREKMKGAFAQMAANAADIIGNPFVVTTGIQHVDKNKLIEYAKGRRDIDLLSTIYNTLDSQQVQEINSKALQDAYDQFISSGEIFKYVDPSVIDEALSQQSILPYQKAVPFEKFKANIDTFYPPSTQSAFGYIKPALLKNHQFSGEEDLDSNTIKIPLFSSALDSASSKYLQDITSPKVPYQHSTEEPSHYQRDILHQDIAGISDVTQKVKFGDGDLYLYNGKTEDDDPNSMFLKAKNLPYFYKVEKRYLDSVPMEHFDVISQKDLRKYMPKRDYIGSNAKTKASQNEEVREKVAKLIPGFTDSLSVIANRHNINPSLMYRRISKEGYLDYQARLYNEVIPSTAQKDFFDDAADQEVSGFNEFGLDDIRDVLESNQLKLTKPVQWRPDENVRYNEKDRRVYSVYFPTLWDAMEVKAAELARRKEIMKQRGHSGRDLDIWTNASYNLGTEHEDLNDTEWIRKTYSFPDYSHLFKK